MKRKERSPPRGGFDWSDNNQQFLGSDGEDEQREGSPHKSKCASVNLLTAATPVRSPRKLSIFIILQKYFPNRSIHKNILLHFDNTSTGAHVLSSPPCSVSRTQIHTNKTKLTHCPVGRTDEIFEIRPKIKMKMLARSYALRRVFFIWLGYASGPRAWCVTCIMDVRAGRNEFV